MQEKNEHKKGNTCVDYRKYLYCKCIWIDDGLADRGLTYPLLFIMIWMINLQSRSLLHCSENNTLVLMTAFSLLSFLMSTHNKTRLDNLRSFLLESMVTMSLFNEFISRKSLRRIHRYMDKAMRSPRQADDMAHNKTDISAEATILENARRKARKHLSAYMTIFSFNIFTMVLSQPLTEWMGGNSWMKLPYPWVFPPSNNVYTFWMVFWFQTIGLFFSHCLAIVIMSFSSITIQITALFDVLLHSIRQIENRTNVRMKREGTGYRDSITVCLKEDVIHHQSLIRELVSATPHLRWTFFALSVTISMIMACEAYPLIMGNFTTGELIKGLLFLVVQFMCWAQMCTRMEIMADQNSEVFFALYETPWYSSGVKYKKLMLPSLIFSKNPMYIKSPLFTEMSATMSTFYSFVVSSFNLLNLIRKTN